MKVLYAIQGTGNGHLSRARDVIPALQKRCDLDVLISGIQADVDIPYPVKYRYKGLSFIFGKRGGVDIWKTYLKSNLSRLRREIRSLPVGNYDLVINDFEPVSAWACYFKKQPCVSLSHQSAVLHPAAPKPVNTDYMGKIILQKYAPVRNRMGFHFSSYAENIYTPVIRKEVRNAEKRNQGHYTVYLPAYDDFMLMQSLGRFKDVQWEIFSKHNKKEISEDNVHISPISNKAFIKSMAESEGVLCGAGFETPAEALFLEKKLLVIPMKTQYEQQCNAAALEDMGVPVIKFLQKKYFSVIDTWLHSNDRVNVNYPDMTDQVIDDLFVKFENGLFSYESKAMVSEKKPIQPEKVQI